MICPVCNENIEEGIKFCTSCGAELAAFIGVERDKIITSQTPEEQMELGDDSVTQLIPENYMTAKGDDSVTQLIPENYMTAKGDDTATMLLDPLDEKVPNTDTPRFKLANQAPPTYVQVPYQQNTPVMNSSVYQKENNLLPVFVIGGLVILAIVALAIIFI